MREINRVLNGQITHDVLFGRTLTARLGEGEAAAEVGFHPDLDAVTVSHAGGFRQYTGVEPPPRVVDGEVRFGVDRGRSRVSVSPGGVVEAPFPRTTTALFSASPPLEAAAEAVAAAVSAADEESPVADPTPSPAPPDPASTAGPRPRRRPDAAPDKEAVSEIVFGRVLSSPEFYTPKGTGRPRASFYLAEYSRESEAPLRVVTRAVGHLQRLNLRPADEIELKGIRHEETIDRKTGAPLPKPSRWFFMFGASHERGTLK